MPVRRHWLNIELVSQLVELGGMTPTEATDFVRDFNRAAPPVEPPPPPPPIEPPPPPPPAPAAADLDWEGDSPEPSAEAWELAEELAEAFEAGEVGRFLEAGGARPGSFIGRPGCGTHAAPSAACKWAYLTRAAGCDFTPDEDCFWQGIYAIDVSLLVGSPLTACAPGRVSSTFGYRRSWGLPGRGEPRLHLEHPSGMVSFYTHCREVVVEPGNRVAQGEIVAYSGLGDGVAHLHFAVSPGPGGTVAIPPRWDPFAFVGRAFLLRGRRPQPTVGIPGVTIPIPPPRAAPRTFSHAWSNLLRVLGADWPAARRRVAKARDGLSSAVR